MSSQGQAQNGTAGGGGGGGGGGHQRPPISEELEHERLSHFLLLICGGVAVILIVYRLTIIITKYVRRVACLTNNTQRYFAEPSSKYSWFKRNIAYAPILRKRHNREIQMSSAVNIGTLPTRLQLLFLVGYAVANIAFCVIDIPFHDNYESASDQLRNRSGVLAVVNMIPLFIMAGRNNPLIVWLNISFDTFNLLHRWFGRIVILEALTHTLAFLIPTAQETSVAGAFAITFKVQYMLFGFIVSPTKPQKAAACLAGIDFG